MRRSVGILSIAVVPAFLATMALAGDTPGHTHSGSSGGYSGTTGKSRGAAGFMGEHVMTGTVTDIDKDEGKVSIKGEGEELELHFPKTALQNLKEGDRVTVQVAIKPASPGAGSTSGHGAERRGSESGTKPYGGTDPEGGARPYNGTGRGPTP